MAEYRRGDSPYRLGSCAATHQDDAIDTGTVAFQSVKTVRKSAHQALDRGPGDVGGRASAQRESVQSTSCVGPIGGAFAFEIRHQDQTIGPRRRLESQLGQRDVVDTEHRRGGVQHSRRVECADKG